MLAARVPCTELNEPPRNALPQPPLNAMLFTSPLTSGFQPDMVNGAVARKLNALFLVNVRPCHLTWLNRPTAYIREPHCTELPDLLDVLGDGREGGGAAGRPAGGHLPGGPVRHGRAGHGTGHGPGRDRPGLGLGRGGQPRGEGEGGQRRRRAGQGPAGSSWEP